MVSHGGFLKLGVAPVIIQSSSLTMTTRIAQPMETWGILHLKKPSYGQWELSRIHFNGGTVPYFGPKNLGTFPEI